MEFVVPAARNATAEIAAADDYPLIRVTSGPQQNADTLNTKGVFNHTHTDLLYTRLPWAVASAQSVGCVDGTCTDTCCGQPIKHGAARRRLVHD